MAVPAADLEVSAREQRREKEEEVLMKKCLQLTAITKGS